MRSCPAARANRSRRTDDRQRLPRCPLCCRGGDSPARLRTCSPYRLPSKWQTPPICHCEEAAGRRGALSAQREEVPLGCNLAGPGWITGQLRRIRKLVREIATGAKRPRNDNSEVHTILTMACTDRQHCAGRGMPLPYNGVYNRREYPEICSCQRRSLTAATDAIGTYHFNDSLSKSAVPSRDCHGREAPSQ